MPPKKRGRYTTKKGARKTINSVDNTEEEEFISQIRQDLLKKKSLTLPKNSQTDIHQNVKEIRAILKMNAEIFDRCMLARFPRDQNRRTWDLMAKTETKFVRSEFHEVFSSHEIREVTRDSVSSDDSNDEEASDDDNESESDDEESEEESAGASDNESEREADNVESIVRKEMSIFRVYPKRTAATFDTTTLSKLPPNLDSLLSPIYREEEEYKQYIDYNEVFESSFALIDDILSPVLVHLKEHLMSVQVCLGEIDNWLLSSNESFAVIKSMFGDDCLQANDIIFNSTAENRGSHPCKCHAGRHDPSELCTLCRNVLSDHRLRAADGKHWCPRRQSSFHCGNPTPLVLNTECSSPGKHEFKFNILDEGEREKLTKYMDFISTL